MTQNQKFKLNLNFTLMFVLVDKNYSFSFLISPKQFINYQ